MDWLKNVIHVALAASRRSYGLRILLISAAVAVVGISPLLLYILLGPSNGNPIGLGLLAMLAVPVAAIGGVIGGLTYVVEFLQRKWR
jgi:hypothetical protein